MRKNMQRKRKRYRQKENVTENDDDYVSTNQVTKRSLLKGIFSNPRMEIFSGPPFLQVTDDTCWVLRGRGAPEGQQGMLFLVLIA